MNQKIIDAMADLDDEILMEEVQAAANAGTPAGEIIADLQKGLDIVGERFAEKEYFLSELMMSASLFNEATELLGGEEEADASAKIGTFVIGTVETDIHDIGKNIVRALLENYGFDVIDLGRDVDPEKIVETAKRADAMLVALSALMTTTVGAMAETVRRLKAAGLRAKTVVGGAVVTQEYADSIGADFYAKDAMRTVRIAETLAKSEAGGV